ncbi:MAG: hypothetical protein WBH40_11900 [Ignavibacteriaceae bacterium]
MGQQQLLLIVLGVILVGVAVVLGIQYFSVGAEEGAKDELVAHCLSVGANAQQWYKKPIGMGGGGGAFDMTNGSLTAWVIPVRMGATTNSGVLGIDGIPTIVGYTAVVGDQTVVITGDPNSPDYNWTVVCTVNPEYMSTVITPGL